MTGFRLLFSFFIERTGAEKMLSIRLQSACLTYDIHNVCTPISVTWLIKVGGGGRQNWPWVLRTLFYKGVRFERGENWSHKTQVFYFIFSLFYLPLLNSVTKKLSLGWKNTGGHLSPSHLTPMCTSALQVTLLDTLIHNYSRLSLTLKSEYGLA
jgi:hypothetical protein